MERELNKKESENQKDSETLINKGSISKKSQVKKASEKSECKKANQGIQFIDALPVSPNKIFHGKNCCNKGGKDKNTDIRIIQGGTFRI